LTYFRIKVNIFWNFSSKPNQSEGGQQVPEITLSCDVRTFTESKDPGVLTNRFSSRYLSGNKVMIGMPVKMVYHGEDKIVVPIEGTSPQRFIVLKEIGQDLDFSKKEKATS
jgi:hypothetical protein